MGSVGESIIGLTYKPGDISLSGVPVLRSGNIKNNKLDLSDIVRVSCSINENLFLIKNDILVCVRNGSRRLVGKSLLLSNELEKPSTFGAFMAVIRSPLNKFIKVFLDTQLFRDELFLTHQETVINQITQKNLSNALIPLPPIEEQKRIVEAIENFTNNISSIDEEYSLIEEKISLTKSKLLDLAIRGKLLPQDANDEPASVLLDRIRKEKDSATQATKGKRKNTDSYIFKGEDNLYYEKIGSETKCIQDEITFEIPKTWTWARLGTVAIWNSGATPKRNNKNYYENGTIPWLKTGDLNDSYVECVSEYITKKAFEETSIKLNKAGSILIAMYGATIGKIGILNMDATTNQACCAAYCHKNLYNLYLFYFLLSQRKNFRKRGGGGAQLNISKEKIVETLIPLPPINEQNRIVEYIFKANEQLGSMLDERV